MRSRRRGFCRTRENRQGALVSLIYGAVAALHVAPIEAKPLYHFHPASTWLSLGSLGCNFRCPGCQNWELAHASLEGADPETRHMGPAKAIDMAIAQGCKGISWTYNEPTLWLEYTIDTGRLARQKGLLANYVTNGYVTPEALEAVVPFLDAFRVDIKAFDRETYRRLANSPDFEGVLESAELAR